MAIISNKQIRIAMILNDMKQYDLAKLMSVPESKVSKMLRTELSDDLQDYIVNLINNRKEQNNATNK